MARARGAEAASDVRAHAKYVELTYNTVATFMPGGEEVSKKVSRRLEAIACAACPAAAGGGGVSVLDVGCGTGLLLPFLEAAAGPSGLHYRGIDLSARMVEAARQAHGGRSPSAVFAQEGFPPRVPTAAYASQPLTCL